MALLPGTGTYHNVRGLGVSDALRRARRPYKLGNAAIGLGLFGFIVSVCESNVMVSELINRHILYNCS